MGFNGDGRLGLASSASLEASGIDGKREPTLVEALRGICVVEVAAGLNHTLARTADGRIFSWGGNEHGQIGLGRHVLHLPSASAPTEIEVPFRRAEAESDSEE